MLAPIALALLVLAAMIALAGGIATALRQATFVSQAYRVEGRVISEWRYRLRGNQRYYRVEFQLRNGQRAELRGSGTRPGVGQQVGVLVRERIGHDPKARIDTWSELWSVPATLLSIGAGGLTLLVTVFCHHFAT